MMHLLIVEDDESMALVMSTLIRSLGEIEMVGTLSAAMEAIAKRAGIDVVLLDLALPDSPPLRTLEQIKSIKDAGAKVVVVTGAFIPDVVDVALAHGADACLDKGDKDFLSRLKAFLRIGGSKSPFA